MSEYTRRSALRSMARAHPCQIFKQSFHSPDNFTKRILSMPSAHITTCEKCAISFDNLQNPFITTHPSQIGLPHYYTCPHRRQQRDAQEAFWVVCLLSHAPPLPHHSSDSHLRCAAPTPKDFINVDPSVPLPQGLSQSSEHDSETLTILSGTFRHRLPKSLINAYASFTRSTQNPRSFLKDVGDLLSMSLSASPTPWLNFRSLPPHLGRFLANTLDLTLVGLSPFVLERSLSYKHAPVIYSPNPTPQTPWTSLTFHSNLTPLPTTPSLICVNDASEYFNKLITRHVLALAKLGFPTLLVC